MEGARSQARDRPTAAPTGCKKEEGLPHGAAIVTLVAAGILISQRASNNARAPGGVKRVAVLWFENLGSPEDD